MATVPGYEGHLSDEIQLESFVSVWYNFPAQYNHHLFKLYSFKDTYLFRYIEICDMKLTTLLLGELIIDLIHGKFQFYPFSAWGNWRQET